MACLLLLLISSIHAQTENWIYQYTTPGQDEVRKLVYGSDGNIYLCGFSGTNRDMRVVSLTDSGTLRWTYYYNGPANENDEALSIIYGADENIYICGQSTGIGSDQDFTIISLYKNSPTERWIYRYNGPGNRADCAFSIIYGLDGNLYAAGYTYGNGSAQDFTIISLTTTGQERWIYTYNGPGNDYDIANSIVYGQDGNLYACGLSTGSTTDRDITVISLTTTGAERWIYRYNGTGNGLDAALSICYGSDGNIYVCGRSERTSSDFTIISLSSDGTERWVYQYDGEGNNDDIAHFLVYAPDSNIYACGLSTSLAGDWDFTVISLTNLGQERWVYKYNGALNSTDCAYSLTYNNNNLYICGFSSESPSSSYDILTVSLTNTGQERWIYRYDGEDHLLDIARTIVYGADNNIYIAGYSIDSLNNSNMIVIDLTVAGIDENCEGNDLLTVQSIFKDKITLKLNSIPPGQISAVIYSINGIPVFKKCVTANSNTLTIKGLSVLQNGVYILQLYANNRLIGQTKVLKL